jgi:hypothetical protein
MKTKTASNTKTSFQELSQESAKAMEKNWGASFGGFGASAAVDGKTSSQESKSSFHENSSSSSETTTETLFTSKGGQPGLESNKWRDSLFFQFALESD